MTANKPVLVSSVIFALMSLAGAPALAQSSHCTPTFCISFPSSWDVHAHGNTLELADANHTISVELRTVTQVAQFAEARRQYEAELSAHATNLEWLAAAQPVTQNGMAGLVRRGRGMLNNRRMLFFMLGLANASGGVVGAGVIVQGASQEEIQQVIDALNTIRPAH